MCGRFTQVFALDWIEAWLGVDEVDPETASVASPRANIAPSQPVLVAFERRGARVLSVADWGFRGGSRSGVRPINARSESLSTSTTFRDAFAVGRCVVPASGFFEWRRKGRERTPFHFTAAETGDPLLRLAAITTNDEHGRSLAIVTAPARGTVAEIHDRMPLLISRDEVGDWLATDVRRARPLLARASRVELARRAVSVRVNDARAEGLDLLDPVEE